MVSIRLSIADFVIDLINGSDYPIKLEDGYSSFVVDESVVKPSVQVITHSEIPASLKELSNPIYSAVFEGNCLWEIFAAEDGLLFHVYSSTEPYQLQQVAKLNASLTVWNIYSAPVQNEAEESLFPLLYPMGPLVMYYLTAKYDAIMIHGSGISDGGKGRIFTGVSGQGKTTMAKLWFDAGAEVLNDDRLIVRKDGNAYTVYNTPMFYVDQPRRSKLDAIYSIYHSAENRLTRLEGAEAISAISPNLIQHGYSSELINHHLNFVSEIIEQVPVFKLGFLPDKRVTQELRGYD